MTIDKAIEILTNMLDVPSNANTLGGIDAIKLGKEALNRIQRQRKELFRPEIELLPGEIKD